METAAPKVEGIFVVGGDILPEILWKRWKEKQPYTHLINAYGLSEFSSVVAATPLEESDQSCGRVGPSIEDISIRIVKKEDISKNNSTAIGEVEVRGPQMMLGYLDNAKIVGIPDRNQWLNTGDLGYLDRDSWLTITGRVKNIVNCGGIKFQIEEIEEILQARFGLKETLICVSYDDILGQRVVLKITKRNNLPNLDNLNIAFSKILGIKKILSEIQVVDFLPLTESGKSLRY